MNRKAHLWLAALVACVSAALLLAGCQNPEPAISRPVVSIPGDSAGTVTAPNWPTGTTDGDASIQSTTPSSGEATSPASSAPSGGEPSAPSGEPTGHPVADLARTLIGTTFEVGASGPTTFDNSGFVYYCFKQNGITLPRRTTGMFQTGSPVEKSGLQPGDAVFFSLDDSGEATFTGIYVGNDQFISCNNENSPTKLQSLKSGYFAERYIGARRYGAA